LKIVGHTPVTERLRPATWHFGDDGR